MIGQKLELRMRIDLIGIRTEEGADNQSGTWTEITTMTVTRDYN